MPGAATSRDDRTTPGLSAAAPELIQRKRGVCDGPQCEGKQSSFFVVARDPVGADHAAAGAAVDDRPFAILANFDADGLHAGATGAGAIARFVIDVARPEAEWTVIPVFGSPCLNGDEGLAVDTRKVVGFSSALVGHG